MLWNNICVFSQKSETIQIYGVPYGENSHLPFHTYSGTVRTAYNTNRHATDNSNFSLHACNVFTPSTVTTFNFNRANYIFFFNLTSGIIARFDRGLKFKKKKSVRFGLKQRDKNRKCWWTFCESRNSNKSTIQLATPACS
jgi:hypothetical protein